ncbi:hypothetical protein BGZ73_005217 [Actinomortierella ambigua]|nr:hypothetical protein BGZ73_005217 [Actinomortierella ambigua]
MPDIANEKRPRDDEDTAASQSNPKRRREDLMQSELLITSKRPREDDGGDVQKKEQLQQQGQQDEAAEASATNPHSFKRRRSTNPDESRASASPTDGPDSDNATVHEPAATDQDEEGDEPRDDALVLANGSQADEQSEAESIVLIDLTSQKRQRSSRFRQNNQRAPLPRDNYPPADSFPRVPLMEEQRGMQLPSMRTYLREFERHNSQNLSGSFSSSSSAPASSSSSQHRDFYSTSQSSTNGHYHVQVSDDGDSDGDSDNDYRDPYHPWAQGPVQLIMNRHGIPPTNSTITQGTTLVPSYARDVATHDRHRTEALPPARLTGRAADAGSQSPQNARAVSPSIASRRQRQQQQESDRAQDNSEDSQDAHHPYEADSDGEPEGDSTHVDDASIIAQGGDGRGSISPIVISDDSDRPNDESDDGESDDALSTQAQHSIRRSPSPIFIGASRSPSPIRRDSPRTVGRRPHTSSLLSDSADEGPPSPIRAPHLEEQAASHHHQQEGAASVRHTDTLRLHTSTPSFQTADETGSLRRHSYPEEQSVDHYRQRDNHAPSSQDFAHPSSTSHSQTINDVTPSRRHSHIEEHSVVRRRSQGDHSSSRRTRDSSSLSFRVQPVPLILRRTPSAFTSFGLTSPPRNANGHSNESSLQNSLFSAFRDQAPPSSSRSSATVTPTATQMPSRSQTVTPNTTQESIYLDVAPRTPSPNAASPSPTNDLPDVTHQPAVEMSQQSNSRSFISRLKCQICWDTPSIPTATQCGHVYCEECIQHWLNANRQCPVCRSSATSHSLQGMEFYVNTKSS